MNTIFMSLVLAAGCFLSGCGLAAYALRHFNSVKLGVNIGRSGFFIEANGKKE